VIHLNDIQTQEGKRKKKAANADTLEEQPDQMRVEIDSVESIEDPNMFSPSSKGRHSRNRLSKVHPTTDSKTLNQTENMHYDDEDWDDID
jgi:hypothetical protein